MRGSQSKSNLESATAPETNSPASVSSKGRENSEKMVKASPAALKSPATPKQILTNPKAFHIYNCFWRNDRCNYPVMILGWDDLTPGGLKSLAETGLLDSKSNPPHCYRYKNRNSPTDAAIVGWAPGFEDGGPKVDSRKFPAMFLYVPTKSIPSFFFFYPLLSLQSYPLKHITTLPMSTIIFTTCCLAFLDLPYSLTKASLPFPKNYN